MASLSPEYSAFFKDLAAHNEREWFHANKKRYEQHVKLPFYELVAELIGRAQALDPAINLEVRNAVFRINRDIRFSKDKSPYKLQMSAIISRGGRKNMQEPGIYVQVEAARLMVAGGCYQPDKEGLQKIREHILRHPAKAEKLNADRKFRACFPDGIGGDRNKILPKPFKEHGEKIPMLYYKQFFYHNAYNGEKYVKKKDLSDFVMEHYKAGEPWMEFLREALSR